jgi:hypothetical protein
MKMPRVACLILLTGALAGCYGTTAPPPVASPTPPPGLGVTSYTPIRVPLDLPGLLRVYRLSLAEAAHHLPPPKAEQYADAELALLTRRYSGRDEELKAELTRRLQSNQPRSAPPPGQAPPAAFPRDPQDEPARSAR